MNSPIRAMLAPVLRYGVKQNVAKTTTAETAHAQGLVFPLKRLVQELCGVLRARDRGIQGFEIQLQFAGGTQTIGLTLHQATRSESHLTMLLRERLERLQLPCPMHHILAGPERIESGWWDGKDCRRDYFVVRDPGGSTLWAFHEYKPRPG